jgi:hypothetical protein
MWFSVEKPHVTLAPRKTSDPGFFYQVMMVYLLVVSLLELGSTSWTSAMCLSATVSFLMRHQRVISLVSYLLLSASLIRMIGKTPDCNVMSTLIPRDFVYIKVCLIS